MIAERRRHKRVPVQFQVTYEQDGERLTGTATNVSRGGLYIETPEPPDEAMALGLEFELDGQLIEVPGYVVSSESGRGFGVVFGRLSSKATKCLESFIETELDAVQMLKSALAKCDTTD